MYAKILWKGKLRGLSGNFCYIPAEQFTQLKRISLEQKNLDKIMVIGRGGFPGEIPFLFKGRRCLCILEEDLQKLVSEDKKIPEEKIKEKESFVEEKEVRAEVKEEALKGEAEKEKFERKEEKIYVYCIIPVSEKKEFGNIGLNKNSVYTIDYKDLSVVVSNCSDLNSQLSEENAKIHENVIKEIMVNSNSIVPMAFGMFFVNEKILKSTIKTMYKAVKKALNVVEEKVELGVKVITNGEMENRDGISDEIFNILKEKSEETKKGNLVSDRLIFNGYFLVKKDKIEEFSNTVEELESKYPNLKFHYSGPWAPYNFVKINIGAK